MKTNPIYNPISRWLGREPFRCQATVRIYRIEKAGNVVRVSPSKPWRGKSERREVIKARRYAKEGLSLP